MSRTNKLTSWIEDRRAEKGLSYRELAEGVGLSHTLVIKTMSGKTAISFQFCVKMAEYFKESPIRFIIMSGIAKDEYKLEELVLKYLRLNPDRQDELLHFIDMLSELDKTKVR